MMQKGIVCLSLLLLTSSIIHAQFKNIKIGELTGKPISSEACIAINFRNQLNAVAVWGGDVYITNDGGLSWQKKTIQASADPFREISLVADPQGNFYLLRVSDNVQTNEGTDVAGDRIVVQISGDNGETWSNAEPIDIASPGVHRFPHVSVDNKGTLYATWTQFDKYGDTDANCHSNILLSTSRNGRKWSEPFQLSQTPGSCVDHNAVAGSAAAISPDGKIFAAWTNQEKIFLDRSYDGGDTWLTNDIGIYQKKSGWKFPSGQHRSYLPVLLNDRSKTSSKGSLYFTWADQQNDANDTDVWFMRSPNFGDNWTTPLRVNDDKPGKHQYLPSMCIDQSTGIIYIVYYDRRDHEDTKTDLYLAYSVNGGGSFKNIRLSESSFDADESIEFATGITAHKGVIIPFWIRTEIGQTSLCTAVIRQEDLIKIK